MAEEVEKVCVRVDCKCPYAPDWLYYPKDIIGLHQVSANDPRVKIGSCWDIVGSCAGALYSQGCDEEDCCPAGRVVEIFSDCKDCPDQADCRLRRK